MKRPVFCVALAYALGEVIGLYTRTVGEIGIVSAMLVCVGIFVRKKKQGKSACVLGLGIGLGMLGAFLRIPQDLREKPDIRQENGYDIITYATGGETQGQPVICAGILTDRQGETWTMRVLDGADVHGDILLRGVEGEHTIAEIVQVTGTYDTFEHVRNPGGFQSRSYYLARNISGYYYAPQVTTITVNQREILGLPRYLYYQGKRILYELRIRADCQIAKLLPEEQASLVSGILLGEKARIDAELKTLYQMGGIAHILAISGVKTLKLDIPLVPETCINWAFVSLHIAIIYILKLCLNGEIIPRCRFPCSRGYRKKYINWQKKQSFSVSQSYRKS